jgi:glycosyltransferase involved in cell wall biosynthesis
MVVIIQQLNFKTKIELDLMTALIIPCYIKIQWDIDCLNRLLDSVCNQTQRFEQVYLVDDASPLKYKPDHDFIELITLNENGGPARARNMGIEKAINSGAQYLLFTDHDCILDKEWNEHMTSFLRKTDFGAVGGMTYFLTKKNYGICLL